MSVLVVQKLAKFILYNVHRIGNVSEIYVVYPLKMLYLKDFCFIN